MKERQPAARPVPAAAFGARGAVVGVGVLQPLVALVATPRLLRPDA